MPQVFIVLSLAPSGFFDVGTLVDVCIPTYKEADYIVKTLQELSKQTLWSRAHVYIADYAPDGDMTTRDAINALNLPNVTIVDCPKSGVGLARRLCTEAGSAPYILTWSADCRFGRPDGMARLVQAVATGECMIAHCPNVLEEAQDSSEYSKMIFPLRNEYEWWATALGVPLCYEEGLTMSRNVYRGTGGWPDVVMGEAPILSVYAALKYGVGPEVFKYIEEVPITVSNRRMKKNNAGFLGLPILDYTKAFRQDQMLDVR